MRLTLSSSDGDIRALRDVTPLPSRPVFAAQAMAFGVLVTTWIFATAALGPVLDADSALDNT
jgi:hypothetical protein